MENRVTKTLALGAAMAAVALGGMGMGGPLVRRREEEPPTRFNRPLKTRRNHGRWGAHNGQRKAWYKGSKAAKRASRQGGNHAKVAARYA
jgi:hypothetical protein